jgi:hypothetical protein
MEYVKLVQHYSYQTWTTLAVDEHSGQTAEALQLQMQTYTHTVFHENNSNRRARSSRRLFIVASPALHQLRLHALQDSLRRQ